MSLPINDVCDYVILRCTLGGLSLNALKLQKLLYYIQAWNLAFYKKPLFDGKFQAWVHGPVNREIYERFAGSKGLYTTVNADDISDAFNPESLSEEARVHIDSVLEEYAPFTGSQLESMTHNEEPWLAAREGFGPAQRCECPLDEKLMGSFYAARLQ